MKNHWIKRPTGAWGDLRQHWLGTTCAALVAWCWCAPLGWADPPRVNVIKTPDRGIQPQAVVDTKGVIHLMYFTGKPAAGDLFYVRQEPGKKEFTAPLRVNSQPGSVVAIGTIRGGQIAVGKGGRVHVAWNGSGKAEPNNPAGGTPMLYTRLGDKGTAFEPQRNLMQVSNILDGGGTVAADSAGNVYVAWHAAKVGVKGEDKRLVWVARSQDEGKTFVDEIKANDQPTGACGCCGMRGFADSQGTVHLFYRAATGGVGRDMILLSSNDLGKTFKSTVVHKWKIDTCPMSSESFAEGPSGVYTAWDTDGQVYFAKIDAKKPSFAAPVAAPGAGKERKHPALAVNKDGEVLLAWTEGTGWQRGGALVWQVYGKAGQPTAQHGRVPDGIPVWGLATVVAGKDGSFTIIH
jgi:hypothetical protein